MHNYTYTMCIYIQTYVHIHIHRNTTHTYIYLYIYIYIHTYTCIRTYMQANIHTYMNMCILKMHGSLAYVTRTVKHEYLYAHEICMYIWLGVSIHNNHSWCVCKLYDCMYACTYGVRVCLYVCMYVCMSETLNYPLEGWVRFITNTFQHLVINWMCTDVWGWGVLLELSDIHTCIHAYRYMYTYMLKVQHTYMYTYMMLKG